MKIIISRKGFDSSNGGCASPIFSNGDIVSLPIPSARALTRYADVNVNGRNLGALVSALTLGKLGPNSTTHLDPDLYTFALPRGKGWRPSFGQTEGQLTHLNNCEIKSGDLFLFFGWFREVEDKLGGGISKTSSGYNRHLIYGWLQIDYIIDVGSNGADIISEYPWLHQHPHVKGSWGQKNSIFVATERLNIPGLEPLVGNLPGGGTFSNFNSTRCLTKKNQSKRSLWSLPAWMAPSSGKTSLSLHRDPNRWSVDNDDITRVLLDSAKIGQEFVLETSDSNCVKDWLSEIFADASIGVHAEVIP